VSLPLTKLFSTPTINGFASWMAGASPNDETLSLAQFKRDRQLIKAANMRKRDPLRLCLKVHSTASRK